MIQSPYLFASHRRGDIELVTAFVAGARSRGVNVWLDLDELRPGEDWVSTIQSALEMADGYLIFLSGPHSEVDPQLVAVREGGNLGSVIVMIDAGITLPAWSRIARVIDASKARNWSDMFALAQGHANLLKAAMSRPAPTTTSSKDDAFAQAQKLASELKSRPDHTVSDETPRSVFLIHGHDDDLLEVIEAHLISHGIEPIVLKRIGGPDMSLWQKFKRWSTDTRYAIALLSPDDLGAARSEYNSPYGSGSAEKHSLQYRARQNVILELGYFYGYLDWDHVFVLLKRDPVPFPRFEMPSDLDGIVYDVIDPLGRWREALDQHLARAGFKLSSSR